MTASKPPSGNGSAGITLAEFDGRIVPSRQGKLRGREIDPNDLGAVLGSRGRGIAWPCRDIQNLRAAPDPGGSENRLDGLRREGREVIVVFGHDVLRRPALMLKVAK